MYSFLYTNLCIAISNSNIAISVCFGTRNLGDYLKVGMSDWVKDLHWHV